MVSVFCITWPLCVFVCICINLFWFFLQKIPDPNGWTIHVCSAQGAKTVFNNPGINPKKKKKVYQCFYLNLSKIFL
jgi:hypothetical protein